MKIKYIKYLALVLGIAGFQFATVQESKALTLIEVIVGVQAVNQAIEDSDHDGLSDVLEYPKSTDSSALFITGGGEVYANTRAGNALTTYFEDQFRRKDYSNVDFTISSIMFSDDGTSAVAAGTYTWTVRSINTGNVRQVVRNAVITFDEVIEQDPTGAPISVATIQSITLQ